MCRAQPSYKKEDKKLDKVSEKDKDLSKKQEAKSGKSGSVSSNSGQESLKKDDRKHGSRFILLISNLLNLVDLMRMLMSVLCFLFVSRDKEPRQDGGGRSCQSRFKFWETKTFQKGKVFW